jgi:tetratricopeptide (TPR) repeat protein
MFAQLIRSLWKWGAARPGAETAGRRLREAVALQQSGDWDAALAIYRELVADDPGNPQLLHLMGSALAGAQRTGEAIDCLRRLAASGAAPPEARLALAGLLNGAGDFDEAASHAEAALAPLAGDPRKAPLAALARDELRKSAIMRSPCEATRRFRRARAAAAAGGPVNVVYFHVAARRSPHATCDGVDYQELIAMSAASARFCMPGARIILLTDEATQFPGLAADRVIRLPAEPDDVVFERTRMQRAYAASPAFDADTIFVDSDTVFHGDARAAFGREFDLAYTVRRGFELMPFNVGVVFARAASRNAVLGYLDACIACYARLEGVAAVRERFPEGIRRWWGDQLVPAAMVGWEHCAREIGRDGCDLAEIDGVLIGLLPADIFNRDADPADLSREGALDGSLVLHFKGARKDGMRSYVATLRTDAGDAGRAA